MEIEELGHLILFLVVLVIVIAGVIVVFKGGGGEILDSIKRIMRFG